ncbi:acyl-CoA synthetase [Zavarzinia sp. CC-PAN008]|uniref:acyl-CoA synthetase n=1 Tax=Zavarzinia sp. CC-PAN008 TaxID=3243332 RepID=UPI003F7454C5
MHPYVHAASTPDKPAFIMAYSGETVTYAELEDRSNQCAQLFRSRGLKRGDAIAVMLENHPRYFEIVWAAQRAGLYFTCISSKLTAGEAAYIIKDCGARIVITSASLGAAATELPALVPGVTLMMVDPATPPFESYETARDAMPRARIADESAGADMLYSSGTTGRPKGVKRPFPADPAIDAPTTLTTLASLLYGFKADDVYLCPAPLYHSAPLHWSMSVQKFGGTVVVLEKFDPEFALKTIQDRRITISQWVPTHFVRLLKLPEDVRGKYDLSSLRVAIHAAAPCPVPIKEQMIEWWGPVIYEYYSGTEGFGFTAIDSKDWLTHKGSVGKAFPISELKICGEDGEPLPPRQEGVVYFAGGPQIDYHNDPGKTAEARNKHGWSTLGDVGWVDEDGYLYLTDRKNFMIISGGVNIYPQEIENLLITHPKVADVAVVGAPDPEMGEKVVAVIQAAPGIETGPALAEELSTFARANLSHVKVPRRIDFMEELPRHATGKLYKRLIRDAYWGKTDAKIV